VEKISDRQRLYIRFVGQIIVVEKELGIEKGLPRITPEMVG
jgi:hypothetical protein